MKFNSIESYVFALLVCLELCSLETWYFPTFVLITERSVHELSIICFYLLKFLKDWDKNGT